MLHNRERKSNRIFNNRRIFTNTLKLLVQHSISLFFGQGLLIGLSILLLTPFISLLYRLALSLTGYSYVTIKNFGYFLLNPLILILLIFLFAVIGVFLLLEACYLITFFTLIENDEKPYQFRVLLLSYKKLLFIFIRRKFTLLPMVWFITLLSNLPLFIFVMKRVRFIRFLADNIWDKPLAVPVAVIIIAVLSWFMIRRLFLFLYSLIEGKFSANSRRDKRKLSRDNENKENKVNKENNKDDANQFDLETDSRYCDSINQGYMKKTKSFRTLMYFLIWNIGIGFAVLALFIFTMAITAIFISGIPDKSLAFATFLTMIDKMNGYFIVGIFAINTTANFALFTHLFFQYKLELNENINIDHSADYIVIRVGSYKTVIQVTIAIFILVNFYFFFDIIRNGSPLDYMNLDMIKVTSHRGFSGDVPENTLPAIEKAIEEQADFIEVDVRMTKDGELVLLHDSNLKRTTGLNKNIWDVNYSDLSSLDAGSWKNKVYIGTPIPTLGEVFDLCKGKVNLNLDLKFHTNKEELEDKVVALIEEYEMEWQCVISSTNLPTLEKVKLLDPDIRTGYITYQIYRGYLADDIIDFFSIRSNLVTKTVSSEVHKSGKEIHVWTVNSKNELERMKRLGVDNVITDDPSYAKEVLYQEESNRFLITLLKIMME
ncbi:hypothetical protein Ana3638_06205 [Anaerocolumna sedimenticola]|uniref:GP-PDE domain-containing protein n=1 Tax=Anaerocolumna sedimenticola TaxID=2696063 RepID=A0A6P1TJ08_9FIRM|nr:glycerophosphodiester phosphodiesterase family protein [Anaerocolumna sedimenticola]QHQ60413.1 hypothetical protein Ana3638_06205 [Anaerocolumna sedimenticola]